jgi:plastocyanin
MRRIHAAAIVCLLATTTVLAACGDSDHGNTSDGMPHGSGLTEGMHRGSGTTENRPTVPGAREIPVVADSLTFAPQKIQLRAGEDVTIALTSKDLEHDFVVEGIGHVVHAARGRTAKGGLVIDDPGVYDFWCSVRGHRGSGMVGTLTVGG